MFGRLCHNSLMANKNFKSGKNVAMFQVQFTDIASLYFISTIIIRKAMNFMDLYDKLVEIFCIFWNISLRFHVLVTIVNDIYNK